MRRHGSYKTSEGVVRHLYVLHLNPEPWAIGSINYKRISPDLTLKAFQDAVRDEMAEAEPLPPGEYVLRFYFWRQQARYLDMNDKWRTRHQADATNMQKALEDALQGVLFDNDRNVRDIHTIIVEQSPETEPRIVIMAQPFVSGQALGLPAYIHKWIMEPTIAPPSDNSWPPARPTV
jgi:Holliday junction resolvase RusA-like endonuclease